MGFLSFLAVPLGIAMRWLYTLVQNYGWTIIIFTFLVRILMLPLSLSQQKNTARMSAFQPMIQEIQKKWAKDKNKQNAELQKFYEENNVKMSAGCLPMAINMLVLFGIIAVIQAPLNYILQVPEGDINAGIAIVQQAEEDSTIANEAYTRQSILIGEIKENPDLFITGAEIPYVDNEPYVLAEGEEFKNGQIVNGSKVVHEEAKMQHAAIEEEHIERVKDFRFQFLGLNLAEAPSLSKWYTLIMPILSILTMVLSQLLIMKISPSPQGKGQMLLMTVLFGVMFGFFAFRVPAGFSLYYTVSNVVMTLQQILMKRIYNPDKIRAEIEEEMAQRKAAKKAKKKVVILDEDSGEVIDKELSESEVAKLRIEKARKLDAEKYGGKTGGSDDDDAGDAKAESEAAEKARKLDEAKYGAAAPRDKITVGDDDDEADEGEAGESEADDAEAGEAAAETDETKAAEKSAPDKADAPDDAATDGDGETNAEGAEGDAAEKAAEYKPGRRKRARQNKEKKEPSFAEEEMAKEAKQNAGDKEEQTDA